jgi:peptidoglycan hydrolase CwlO-like protein
MPFAPTRMGVMESKITLEFMAAKIDDLTTTMDRRFDAVEQRLKVIDQRLTKIEQRVDLIGYSVYNIQIQTENMEQEMKGIHKVIDNLSGRITAVENYLGFPSQNPLFEF